MEFHARIDSITPDPLGDETTAALLTGATEIPLADTADFSEAGGSVRIDGEVYTYSTMEEGDEYGETSPTITLDSGLVADVADGTRVEVWNPSANDGAGGVVTDWLVEVTDDTAGTAGTGGTAYLSHTLIPLMTDGSPSLVGESVIVRVESDDTWRVIEVIGKTPALDPGYIKTGTLAATTTVIAGDPEGKRVQMDGTGTPAFEAYDASNVQTVNIDGEDNYIEGTLATAASGARIEIGPLSGTHPTNQVRLYSSHADEVTPATFQASVSEPDPGLPQGLISIVGQTIDSQAGTTPGIYIQTSSADGGSESVLTLDADVIRFTPPSLVDVSSGTLLATMSTGSVGTGTFRDSVDARVDALVPAASDTTAGKVELATSAETITGTDTTRAVTPANVAALLAGMGHIERSADGTQSITTAGSGTVALWQDNIVAGRGGVSYSAGVFTIATAGTYTISASVGLAANATGTRIIALRRNGADIARADNSTVTTAGLGWSATVGQTIDCAASDTIDVLVYQNSGSSLAVSASSYITIHRVA